MSQCTKAVLVSLLVGAVPPALAVDSFRAVCVDTNTVGYRYIDQGTEGDQGWNDGEKFLGDPWEFTYEGEDVLILDGQPIPVVAEQGDTLLAAQIGSTWSGVSSWVYVINLGLEQVVASNSSALTAEAVEQGEIKTRSTSFDCEFTF